MAKKKYSLTTHSKKRLRERANISSRGDLYSVFQHAMRSGYCANQLEGSLKKYLLSKQQNGAQAKIYNGMVFIYRKALLITSYGVPEQYHLQLDLLKCEKKLNKKINNMKIKEVRGLLLNSIDAMIIEMNKRNYSIDRIAKLWQVSYLATKMLNKKISTSTKYKKIELKVNRKNAINLLLSYRYLLEAYTENMIGFGASKKSKTKREQAKDTRNFTKSICGLLEVLDFLHKHIIWVNERGMKYNG